MLPQAKKPHSGGKKDEHRRRARSAESHWQRRPEGKVKGRIASHSQLRNRKRRKNMDSKKNQRKLIFLKLTKPVTRNSRSRAAQRTKAMKTSRITLSPIATTPRMRTSAHKMEKRKKRQRNPPALIESPTCFCRWIPTAASPRRSSARARIPSWTTSRLNQRVGQQTTTKRSSCSTSSNRKFSIVISSSTGNSSYCWKVNIKDKWKPERAGMSRNSARPNPTSPSRRFSNSSPITC